MASWILNTIGAAAAICSMTSFVPQLVKICRERHAEDMSLRMYVVTVTGFTLWSLYGVLLGSWPLIASNVVSLGLSVAILVMKLRYSRKRAAEPEGPAARSFGAEPGLKAD